MKFLLTILLALNGFIAAAQPHNFSSVYNSGSKLYVHAMQGLSLSDTISIKTEENFVTFSFDWQINGCISNCRGKNISSLTGL